MVAEIKIWWKRAEIDLRTAQNSFNSKDYYASAFWCQQAVEKALKSLFLKRTGNIRKIHDLVVLGKEVDIPETTLKKLKELTLAYIYSRYPDVKQERNLKEKSSEFLDTAKEVLKWVKENL